MSNSVILQALGWIPVVWLLTVHLMVERGRLPREGAAFRIAGCAAAGVVLVAGVAFRMWPVAALGLLWLRTEVFAHRHSLEQDEARHEQFLRDHGHAHEPTSDESGEDHHDPAPLWHPERYQPGDPGSGPAGRQPTVIRSISHEAPATSKSAVPAARSAQSAPSATKSATKPVASGTTAPKPAPATRSHRHLDREHRHQRFGPRAVDAVFKIEVMIVVIVALVIFTSWAQHQRLSFGQNANASLCRFMGGC